MQIAVITVQREPMYLWDTLHGLERSLLVTGHDVPRRRFDVFIGSPAGADEIVEQIFVCARPHRVPDDIWTLIEPLPPHLRAVGNFVAALRSGDGDIVLFEDDIVIKPGWLDAIELVRELLCNRANTFVSLYSHKDFRRQNAPYQLKFDLLNQPIVDFYGTLGLFVPAKHRKPLADTAYQHLLPSDPRPVEQRWPFDEIVKMYVNDHPECSLAVTIPSYVDHVGEVSLINPTHGPRRAPMF